MSNLMMTDLGANLITRSMGESKKLLFTKVLCGDGITSVDPKLLVGMVGTNTKPMTITGVGYEAVDESVDVECSINNEGIVSSFIISEFGVFAKLEGDTSDILFGFKNNKDTPVVLYPFGNDEQVVERTFKFSVGSFSNVGDVSNKDYSNKVSVENDYFKKIIGGLLGVAQHSLSNDLPDNTGNWGWFDGGEIKKADYPDLWERVRPDVDRAVANVTSGTWEYLGSNNLKSYYGWYKGTTDEYFRKPNLMLGEYFLEIKSSGLAPVMSGVCGGNTVKAHTHDTSTIASGDHNHSYYLGGNGESDNVNMPSASDAAINYQYYTTTGSGAHTHTFTTTAAHTHTLTFSASGGTETRPPNIAVKVYGLLRF